MTPAPTEPAEPLPLPPRPPAAPPATRLPSSRDILGRLLTGHDPDRPLVDIGSSTVSGLRQPSPFTSCGNPERAVAHPIQHTRSLDARQAVALGSDLLRAGWAFPPTALDSGGCFVDATGVRWIWTNGEPALLGHPLEHADVRSIRRHPHPVWSLPITAPDARSGLIRVVEPPCPGMLELAMALRNPWQFLHDITDGWRTAGALLDWSLEVLLDAYTRTLAELSEPPDLVLYPDVIGFQAGMYLAVPDFRTQYLPRLRELLAQLRALCEAPVLLHCRGAVAPVLADLATLEPELIRVQRDVAGLELTRLRATVSACTALHGVTDLVRLGRALADGNWQRATGEMTLLAQAWPAVAAPLGIVPADVPDSVLTRAASFVQGLTPQMLRALRDEPDPVGVLAPLFRRANDPGGIPPAVDLANHDAATRS